MIMKKNIFTSIIFVISIFLIITCGGNKEVANQANFNDSTPSLLAMLSKGDSARVEKFIADLQNYIKNNDKQAIAKRIKFPIYSMKNEQEFLAIYDKIFVEEMKNGILEQRMQNIFSNYEGVCIGGVNYNIWIAQTEKSKDFLIYSINYKEAEININAPDCVFGKWINTKDGSDTLILEKKYWRRSFSKSIPREALEGIDKGKLRVLDEKINGFDALNESGVKCKGKYLLMIVGLDNIEPTLDNYFEYTLVNGILSLSDNTNFKKIK